MRVVEGRKQGEDLTPQGDGAAARKGALQPFHAVIVFVLLV